MHLTMVLCCLCCVSAVSLCCSTDCSILLTLASFCPPLHLVPDLMCRSLPNLASLVLDCATLASSSTLALPLHGPHWVSLPLNFYRLPPFHSLDHILCLSTLSASLSTPAHWLLHMSVAAHPKQYTVFSLTVSLSNILLCALKPARLHSLTQVRLGSH